MPVVVDNVFSKDTYGMRTERLIAIQTNFDLIQPDLSAPANIATWAEDCYDVYANLLALSQLEANESEGATVVVSEKEAALDEVYQYVKNMGLTIYKDMPKFIEDYGFEFTYPLRRDDKLACADKVILCYNRHVVALVTPLIPQVMITRLEDAKDEFKTAIGNQDKERSDARHAVANISEQFAKDTQKLNELKIWAYAMLGKQDPRMGLIGMVNPGTGGGGKVPAAPTNLQYDQITGRISWESTPEATSFKVMVAFESEEFLEIYSDVELETYYVPPSSPSSFILHVFARSSAGYGDFASLTVNYDPPLQPPDYMSLTVTNPTLRTIAINWGDSVGANAYRLFHSAVALSAPQGEFSLVGEYSITSYNGTVNAATRNYFYVVAVKGEETSAPSDVSYIDML